MELPAGQSASSFELDFGMACRGLQLGLIKRFTQGEMDTICNFCLADQDKVMHQLGWAATTFLLVNINMFSLLEETIVWQRVYGSKT